MVYLHTGPMGVHRACFFIARAGEPLPRSGIAREINLLSCASCLSSRTNSRALGDFDPCCVHQLNWPSLALAITDHAREHPVPAADSLEVFLLDPFPALLAMASTTPSHQLPEDSVIHCLEGALTHRMAMIHGPAFDLLIQTPDQVSRRHAS